MHPAPHFCDRPLRATSRRYKPPRVARARIRGPGPLALPALAAHRLTCKVDWQCESRDRPHEPGSCSACARARHHGQLMRRMPGAPQNIFFPCACIKMFRDDLGFGIAAPARLTMRARKNGVRGAGAFEIRCGKLARSRESDWPGSSVKTLIPTNPIQNH